MDYAEQMMESFSLLKLIQLAANDSIQINKEGDPAQNYEDFEQGQDFYEGRNVNPKKVYTNLNYEQFVGIIEALTIT